MLIRTGGEKRISNFKLWQLADTELIFIDRLAEIKVPILLLWGRNDKIVPVHHAEYAANFNTNIQLHVFEKCGHWPHMEFHEEFNDLVVNFCAESL